MNVTLIQPFTMSCEPPISLAVLMGPLKQAGHTVRLIDLQIPYVRQNWERVFISEPVDLVGITAMTPQVMQANEIARKIKAVIPEVPVVLGGVHATFLPEQTLYEFSAFDILVLGEGEHTVVELVANLECSKPIAEVEGIAYRSNGSVVITPSRTRILDLDNWPNHHEYYDFDFYIHNNSCGYTEKCVSTVVSRGCPYNCRFCATKNFWTKKYICKSTTAVIKEVRYILNRGVKDIMFRDSTFVINKKWIHEFCKKILQQKLKFRWGVQARAELVDFELLSHMKKAGLNKVSFGVESGSQKILDFYGKEITLKQVEKAFEVCRKLRIDTEAYFMLGALPETREDMELTYQFAKKLKPSSSRVFLFMPLPGSELYEYYIEQGYHFKYEDIHSGKATFPCSDMTLEELEEMRMKWKRDFRRKTRLLARGVNLMMGIRSLSDIKRACYKVSKRLKLRSPIFNSTFEKGRA